VRRRLDRRDAGAAWAASLHAIGAQIEANRTVPAAGPYVAVILDPVVVQTQRGRDAGRHAHVRQPWLPPVRPLVWVKGNVSRTGAVLLYPTTARSAQDFSGTPPPGSQPSGPTPPSSSTYPPTYGPSASRYQGVTFGIAEPFEARSPVPFAWAAAALASRRLR